MAGLRAPAVREKPVPFFTGVKLSKLEQACRGNTFAQRARRGDPGGVAGDGRPEWPSWPGSAMAPLALAAATWIWTAGRFMSAEGAGRDRIVYCRRITDSPKPTESWSICSLTGHQRTSAHADERILTRPNSRSDRDPGSRPYARTTPKPGEAGPEGLSTSSLPTLRTRTVRSKCHEQCPYQPFQRAVPCRSRRAEDCPADECRPPGTWDQRFLHVAQGGAGLGVVTLGV